MKPFQIAIKNLKSVWRDMKSNAIVFVLPIVFIGIFAIAFGKPFDEISFNMGIVKDARYTDTSLAKKVVDFLPANIQNAQDQALFKVTEFESEQTAIDQIKNGKLALLLIATSDTQIVIKGDQANPYFTAASGIISDLAARFKGIDTSFIKTEPIQADLTEFTGFDLLVPGLIVYGILILIPQVATNMAELTERKTIFRYFTSRATARDIFLGYLISQTVLAVIQTLILFLAATSFGFRPTGSIILALAITIPTNLFAVGAGLLIGGFTGKESSASSLGTLVSIILGFFSGSFISGVQNIVVFGEINGNPVRLVDVLPTYHATEALKAILLYGKGIVDVLPQIALISISGFVVLLAGIAVYHQRQMSKLS